MDEIDSKFFLCIGFNYYLSPIPLTNNEIKKLKKKKKDIINILIWNLIIKI